MKRKDLETVRKIYGLVGRCIYCGTQEGDLTREHIIPAGLGGRMILPRASCEKCADATKKVEQTCLRTMFGAARIRMGFHTNHPKQRPAELPVHILTQQNPPAYEIKSVPASSHPSDLFFMELPAPRLVAQFYPQAPKSVRPWVWMDGDPQNKATELGGLGFRSAPFSPIAFCRMLAKIAHGYVVAELGYKIFDVLEPLLPDLILGTSTNYQDFVGGSGRPVGMSPTPHWLNIKILHTEEWEYLLVHTWIIANVASPRYLVVVGRRPIVFLDGPEDQLPVVE
jgi:hypothetical protein